MEFPHGSNVYLRASVTRRQYTIPATFPVREPFDVVYLPAVATTNSKKYELEWSKGVIVESPYAFPRLSNEAGGSRNSTSNTSNDGSGEGREESKKDGNGSKESTTNTANGPFVTLGDLKHPTDASICMLLTDSFHKGIYMIHFGLDNRNCVWLNPHNSWKSILRNASQSNKSIKVDDIDVGIATILDIKTLQSCMQFQSNLYHHTNTIHFTETQRRKSMMAKSQDQDGYVVDSLPPPLSLSLCVFLGYVCMMTALTSLSSFCYTHVHHLTYFNSSYTF